MLTAGTVLFIATTYVVMIIAFVIHRQRSLHITLMSAVITIDFLFPVYLLLTKEWGRRLIEQEEILSFMVWMHLLLVMTLYVLYIVQIRAARGILRGETTARLEHKSQGLGILIVKALVLVSGAMLVDPGTGDA